MDRGSILRGVKGDPRTHTNDQSKILLPWFLRFENRRTEYRLQSGFVAAKEPTKIGTLNTREIKFVLKPICFPEIRSEWGPKIRPAAGSVASDELGANRVFD